MIHLGDVYKHAQVDILVRQSLDYAKLHALIIIMPKILLDYVLNNAL